MGTLVAFTITFCMMVMAAAIGAPEVRQLRERTGDRSWVTWLLGLYWLKR